jgi:BMFP domain-containing protein YqiC
MARRLTTLKQRIRRSLAEMDYAQRRMFEIRTGVPATGRLERARDKAMIAELEAHWRM